MDGLECEYGGKWGVGVGYMASSVHGIRRWERGGDEEGRYVLLLAFYKLVFCVVYHLMQLCNYAIMQLCKINGCECRSLDGISSSRCPECAGLAHK